MSDYFMQHRPAGPDYGAPMHDVTEMFSDYFYEDPYSFDFGAPGSQGSIRQIIDAQGNPNKQVTVYRAVPKGVDPVIRSGDWVTISREYAEQHGTSNVDGYDLLSATVRAGDLWTEGNSVNEWGYWGSDVRTARTYTALVEDGSEYLRTPGAKIDWTPAEAPFDGIWFGFNGRDQTFASYYHAGIYDEDHYLLNKAWSDERIAKLQWTPSGEVAIIWTKSDYRRIGLATALFNWTKANIFPGLQHSNDMTSSGYEWAKSMGHDPEDWELMRALPHYAASAGKLCRGVRIDLGVDLSLAQPGTSIETVGQELQLGPQVLDALSRQGGLGTHWSTRPEIAERFALESSGNGGGTPALITVDWNGSGEDHERTNTGGTWADEAEITLLPGTQVTVTSVVLGSSFRDGVEVLHNDTYLRYTDQFQDAGLPVPQGGPQIRTTSRTAEWQPWHSDDQEEAQEIAPGTTIYRGMKVDFSDSDFDQIWRWQQPPLVEEERGQHFKIGPFILDRLEPLGIHWTTKRRIAEIGASQGGYGGAGIIIEAEYTGTGQDLRGTAYHNDGWSAEEEITMLPGAQVRITGVFLTGIEKNKNLLRGPELRSATVQAVDLWRSENSVNEFDYRENRIAGDYFMNHRPAGPSNGSPMHDVSYHFPDIETLPRNVYDDMQPGGQDSIQQIIDAQGNPNKPVTIYRGVPKGVDPVIRNGDWVTISREYAVEHGYYFDESDVLSATVQAKDLWTSGDSVNEFGYWGSDIRTARTANTLRLTAETIQYQRNNNGMRGIEGFGQDIEPWGKYMILDAPRELPAGWERGEVTFNNPLRIDYADGGWKQELVDRYGTTGKDLSQALLSDGYDGIITEDKYGVAEIVDIRTAQRTAGTRTDPGGVYRGINVQVLSHDEQEEVAAWANGNSFSMYDYQLAEPNYELVYRILDRLDSGGLGRHWSKDYDVSADFARDQGDGIELILIGHWDGQGVDTREFHRGYDGVQRPSNLPHEEEVTLYPGTPVTLVGMDIVTETGLTYNIPVPNIQVTASSKGVHPSLQQLLEECKTSDTTGSDMAIVEAFGRMSPEVVKTHPNWNYLLGLQGQVKDHTTSSEDMAMVEELARYAHRTAAEPGGVLPWNPSHRGYTWITHSDGTLEAVTNDGVNRMYLHEYPHGWEWEVFDSLGYVEGGTFGMALRGGDALRQRANELLAEFDTRAEMRTRGPSRGYQDDYTPAPNTLWSKREAWSNSPWADYDFENPTYAPYGPLTLYRGFSFEANPGVADQLLERLKSGEPVAKVFEDALIESRYSAMQFGDRVGVYWSTDKDYALNLAMVDSFLEDHVGLYIQAHWEGGDHDINFGTSDRKNYWGNESEVRLLPGTEVKGLEVGIYVGGRWHTSGTGQSFTAERTSPSSARKTTSERYAERLRREGRR